MQSKNAASAAAQLDAAQHQLDYAKQQLDRDRAQAAENLIAPAQLEQTQNAYASALAQRNQAQQQAGAFRRSIEVHDAHRRSRGRHHVRTGRHRPERHRRARPVYNLAWNGDIDVVCDVPESALAALAVGERANVTLAALPGKAFTARVRELSPAADPQSRTYRAKLTLEAPTPDVRLGMTADVTFAQAAPSQQRARRSRFPPPRSFTTTSSPPCGSCKPRQRAGIAPRRRRALRRAHRDRHARPERGRARRVARRAYGVGRARKCASWRRCIPRTSRHERAANPGRTTTIATRKAASICRRGRCGIARW